MAKKQNERNPNIQQNHENEEIYENIGKYESLTTELVPTAVMPQQETESSKKDGKKKKSKQTKKEKKELRTQQAQLEKELVKEGKIAPRYRYVPRNNFARILSVCIAFVIGFFAAFGALIGGFAIFGDKKKIKDLTEIAGVDASAIFTDYAADLSALDLIVEIVQKIKNGDFKTLNSVAAYTPFVDKLADQLVTQLADAEITVDKAELMAVPFSEFGKWFQENVAGAYSDEYINTHTLGDVLDIGEDSATILQTLKDTLICDLGEKTQTLTLSDMLGQEAIESNKILRNLSGSTLDTLSSDVQKLTMEQVFGDEMYSYLSMAETRKMYEDLSEADKENAQSVGNGTYAELVAAYEINRKTKAASYLVPYAVELKEGEEIVTETDGETVKYFLYRDGVKADELDRYLCGVWYLIFGDEGDTNVPVLEINTKLIKAVEDLNGTPLWKLWLHDLIEQNPCQQLPRSFKPENDETVYTNLNEFTVKGIILYVQAIISDPSLLVKP